MSSTHQRRTAEVTPIYNDSVSGYIFFYLRNNFNDEQLSYSPKRQNYVTNMKIIKFQLVKYNKRSHTQHEYLLFTYTK